MKQQHQYENFAQRPAATAYYISRQTAQRLTEYTICVSISRLVVFCRRRRRRRCYTIRLRASRVCR